MNNKYYIVLSGAKKNVGDFLIEESSLKLLKYFKPNYNFHKYYYWDNLSTVLKEVNQSEGIIMMGGPSFTRKMYPHEIPLVSDLKKLHVPIYTLGLGWKGIPGDKFTVENFQYPENTKRFIKKIAEYAPLSCREIYTVQNLENQGIKNTILTGCPVLFEPEYVGKQFKIPEKISRVVFTPAQNLIFHQQTIQLMEKLRETLPDAEIICSFHRGIEADQYTTRNESVKLKEKAQKAQNLEMKVIDASYSTQKIDFYKHCDIHIGYRVHAHLYFLRNRIPSLLLHEDGRGAGFSETLRLHGINAFERTPHSERLEQIRFLPKIPYSSEFVPLIIARKNAVADMVQLLENTSQNKFESFRQLHKRIDDYFLAIEKHITLNIQ